MLAGAGWDNIRGMPEPSSLFLAPVDATAAPAPDDVRQVLQELAIIGDRLGPASYAAGDGFSRHVVYAGCSPYLEMQPPEKGSLQFCHVAVHGPYPEPRLVTGANTVKPRCPACRARFDDWRQYLKAWQAGAAAQCSGCGRTWHPHQLDWRNHAISGRVLIELRNVFPGEASPSDLLLQRLAEQTGADWHYGWAAYLSD